MDLIKSILRNVFYRSIGKATIIMEKIMQLVQAIMPILMELDVTTLRKQRTHGMRQIKNIMRKMAAWMETVFIYG